MTAQEKLAALRRICEAATRPAAQSTAEWIHRKDSRGRLIGAAPALVGALESLCTLATDCKGCEAYAPHAGDKNLISPNEILNAVGAALEKVDVR